MAKLSRRRLLLASALLLAPIAPACTPSLRAEAGPTLQRMARLLWPHNVVADEVYAQAADGLLADARDRLYALPAVWQAIGYPGSSLEFGGYRNRGYDDIDWLPEVR
jgi:hypothetical protein